MICSGLFDFISKHLISRYILLYTVGVSAVADPQGLHLHRAPHHQSRVHNLPESMLFDKNLFKVDEL